MVSDILNVCKELRDDVQFGNKVVVVEVLVQLAKRLMHLARERLIYIPAVFKMFILFLLLKGFANHE
ncbi:MAG: hypothetical protein UY50_C0025G0032 [Parcubacteria group bacterium GW2011_GWA2_49_9]|nr:MAG: hypothetical protein UY50_C0025G0032 [Parcubacteria group bacterium GW2011_GWA2_49_9]